MAATNMLEVVVLSAEGELYRGAARQLTAPTEAGEITILPGHENLIANLDAGELVVSGQSGEELVFVAGGILEVGSGSRVRVLADTAIRSDAIDEAAAREARERAEKNIGEAKDEREEAIAKAQLLQALAQLRVAERRRTRVR